MSDVGRTHTADPWTSHAAARSVLRAPQRLRVLRVLEARGSLGATDSELGDFIQARETSAGTRRKELEEVGYCERTTRTRLTHYGNAALVHVITPAGSLALIAHDRKEGQP